MWNNFFSSIFYFTENYFATNLGSKSKSVSRVSQLKSLHNFDKKNSVLLLERRKTNKFFSLSFTSFIFPLFLHLSSLSSSFLSLFLYLISLSLSLFLYLSSLSLPHFIQLLSLSLSPFLYLFSLYLCIFFCPFILLFSFVSFFSL